MRVKNIYDNDTIPKTIRGQIQELCRTNAISYERMIKYLKSEAFAQARGFSGEMSEKQLVREMHEVIRMGIG